MATNFVITKEISVNGNKITKFRSSKTGLSVVHVDNEGPIVNGYFTLATECKSQLFSCHVKRDLKINIKR
ncbi:hypothetical protein BG015_006576 [Linnemannia schmuckeri]|uniref:Uncharacterized protein n=1 Tax=Linnemannia schmuckeri TaxID=64567 RepID=A0A9P5RZL1_9FUNG|nr:hypothetical protein BG015_006576 [Linnemannia schmuckeri]